MSEPRPSPAEFVERVHIASRRTWDKWDRLTLAEDDGVVRLSSDVPFSWFNSVLRAALASPQGARQAVQRVAADARERSVPAQWWLTESSTPLTLGEALLETGFARGPRLQGMRAWLDRMDDRIKSIKGLCFEPVDTPEQLARWADLVALVFDFEGPVRDAWLELHEAIGYTGEHGWRHHLALVNDTAVGAASMWMAEENAAVSHVSTHPDYRGASIGTAITIAALAEARARGCTTSTLFAPESAANLYARIGFQRAGALTLYALP